ncbi:hypothetical protein L2E82_44897 [Cichorium intybus]|uniref:Uncharacterized protein n=1 Tax=Cichorium intybus TaxID=13427 RepID=A0ACB8ZSD4_CICIN|nr:hypothetical protein L2E82_44897 [Cichorium intybus]
MEYHDERRFLHHLARTCCKNGELDNIIDQRLKNVIKPRTLRTFSAIAYQCLQKSREERPTSAEIVYQLKEARKIQLEDEGDAHFFSPYTKGIFRQSSSIKGDMYE